MATRRRVELARPGDRRYPLVTEGDKNWKRAEGIIQECLEVCAKNRWSMDNPPARRILTKLIAKELAILAREVRSRNVED